MPSPDGSGIAGQKKREIPDYFFLRGIKRTAGNSFIQGLKKSKPAQQFIIIFAKILTVFLNPIAWFQIILSRLKRSAIKLSRG
jgi:hypothetical protein